MFSNKTEKYDRVKNEREALEEKMVQVFRHKFKMIHQS
jgi:hypothetical protein